MSLIAIRNGLFATLTACGPWTAAEISACCFDPLEHTSACAIVFLPGESEIMLNTAGNRVARGYRRLWELRGTLYVKDTGDPKRLLGGVWQGCDDIYNTIAKDDSLQSSACAARLTRISFNQDAFVEAAGALWAPIRFSVQAEEF